VPESAAHWFLEGRPGSATALMTEAAVQESVPVAGQAVRARAARTFAGGVPGSGHPCWEVALLH
jgi:hypothetical protein